MNKLCPYFQEPGYGEDVLSVWPSPAALFMDIDADFVARLREKFPALEIVVRFYEEESHGWRKTSPEEYARRFVAIGADYAISWTMPLGQDNGDLFAEFDDWSVRFAIEAKKYDVEPVGLCVGTGNFTGAEDRIKVSDVFPGICQTYDFLGPQDYGWPTLRSPGFPWHALRWTVWHNDIEEAFGKDMSFMPMECGLTQAVLEGRPDVGWQTYDDGVTDESYLATMRWYNERLCQLAYVKYAFVYLFHGYGDWATFDHVNKPQVWHVMKDFDARPNGGDEMDLSDVRVFRLREDYSGMIECVTLAEKEALVFTKYGAAFRRADVASGQKVYRLAEIWEKTGTSSLITQVLNEDGQPMANVDVAFYWEDAPDQSAIATVYDWFKNFVHGPTNKDGDVGPGMGEGAYHGEGEGGPHATWVRDANIPSDIFEKLGMLAGTFHDHLDHKFKLVSGEGPEPSPNGDKVLKFKERLEFDHESNMVGIAIDDDYAVQNDARGDFRGPGVDEPPIEPVAWIYPDTGERMALLEGCGSFNGDVDEAREFTMQVRNLKTSSWLTGDHSEAFLSLESGVGLKRVVYVYELAEGPDPDPGPDPPLDDVVEQIVYHLDEAKKLVISSQLANVAEVHLLDKVGNKRVFVPKGIMAMLARLVGK